MKSIFEVITELEKARTPFAICTIIDSKGSTPRSAGSKMVVTKDGQTFGTVGGGDVELRARQYAEEAIKTRKSTILSYNMVDPEKGDPGICGGSLQVFIEPVNPFKQAVIIGGGHVGKAVAFLAKWIGFYVTMIDDRDQESSGELSKFVDESLVTEVDQITENISIDADTIVIITTRDHEIDVKILPMILQTPAAYIGVIGSRRRWKIAKERLLANGVSRDDIARIYSPIGLNLGAQTPEEIAVCIISEVMKTINNKSGESLRD